MTSDNNFDKKNLDQPFEIVDKNEERKFEETLKKVKQENPSLNEYEAFGQAMDLVQQKTEPSIIIGQEMPDVNQHLSKSQPSNETVPDLSVPPVADTENDSGYSNGLSYKPGSLNQGISFNPNHKQSNNFQPGGMTGPQVARGMREANIRNVISELIPETTKEIQSVEKGGYSKLSLSEKIQMFKGRQSNIQDFNENNIDYLKDYENKRGIGFVTNHDKTKLGYLTSNCLIGDFEPPKQGMKGHEMVIDKNLTEKQAIGHLFGILNVSSWYLTVILLLYTLMSYTHTLFKFGRFEPRFVLWIYGKSGTYKSTVAWLMTYIFRADRDNDILSSAIDTPASLDSKYRIYQDIALLCDDQFTSDNPKSIARMREIREKLIRQTGERVAKSRALIDQTTRSMELIEEYRPDIGPVCTAEDLPTSETDLSRVLVINTNYMRPDWNCLDYYNDHKVLYATAVYYFILWSCRNYRKIVPKINRLSRMYRKKFRDQFAHSRLHDTMTSLNVICDILFDYIEEVGVMSNESRKTIHNEFRRIIFETVAMNSEELIEEKPGVMVLEAMKELIDRGEVSVFNKRSGGFQNGRTIGYEDEEKYYIFPDSLHTCVYKYYKQKGRLFSITKKKMIDELEVTGAIEVRNEKRPDGKIKRTRTIKCGIEGMKNKRFLVVSKDRIDELLYGPGEMVE